MTSPSSEAAAIFYWPDLQAVGMHITADYAAGQVNVSATTDNIGVGTASGPFIIAVQVSIENDTNLTEYAREFEVPSDVIIYGRPLYEQGLTITSASEHAPSRASASTVVIPPWLHRSYTTGVMSVPLEFVDVNGAYYTASFLVDPYYQVPDYNRSNNQYTWPGRFFFLSPAGQARARKEPLIIKRSLVRQ